SRNRTIRWPQALQNNRWIRRTALPALMMAGVVTGAASAAVIHSTWNAGADGSWGTAASWSPAGVPNNSGSNFYHVRVDSSAASVTVTIGSSYTIDWLGLDDGDRVVVANGQALQVNAANGSGVVENRGTVELGAGASSTYFRPRGG